MLHLFQVFIYQPFFNLLVGLYWLLDLIPGVQPDMGVAVIIFTIFIRILLLPVSLTAHRQEKTRKEIEAELEKIEEKFSHDPVRLRQESKTVFRRNRGVVVAELFSLTVQVVIALMLWRIFGSGLPGEDIHLIYPWMPKVDLPFNLIFLGRYDLSHPDWHLNIVQSILIFVVESLSIYVSPYPPRQGEVVRLQLVLPIVSFIIFSQLPAGKKLFIIVTLLFSLVLILIRVVIIKIREIQDRLDKKDQRLEQAEEKVVVDVKA